MFFEPTNTLASANFDILKMDYVEDSLVDVNKLASIDFEESYMAKAVEFINETRDEITNSKIIFYQSLSEATTERAVLESFADFFSGVKDIINKFIQFLRKLVDKFIATIMKLVKSDSYIKKNKELFKHLDPNIEFEFKGFEYVFSPLVPLPHAALDYNRSLFDDLYTVNGTRELTSQSVRYSISSMNLEKEYDRFRGRVLNKDGEEITISEFSQELYKVYRNGRTDTTDIIASNGYINKCLDRFLNYSKMQSEVTHQRDNIIKAYNSVQKQVQEITKSNTNLDKETFIQRLPNGMVISNVQTTGSGTMMAAELMTQIDIYVRAKIEQIQEFSNIHLLSFGAKLDAMKECLNQDRTVLYTALQRSKIPFGDMKGDKK